MGLQLEHSCSHILFCQRIPGPNCLQMSSLYKSAIYMPVNICDKYYITVWYSVLHKYKAGKLVLLYFIRAQDLKVTGLSTHPYDLHNFPIVPMHCIKSAKSKGARCVGTASCLTSLWSHIIINGGSCLFYSTRKSRQCECKYLEVCFGILAYLMATVYS